MKSLTILSTLCFTGLMLSGLWLRTGWSTALLLAGGVLFLLGVPRAMKQGVR